jgi:thiol-disulfide isomerase/thioredoxin
MTDSLMGRRDRECSRPIGPKNAVGKAGWALRLKADFCVMMNIRIFLLLILVCLTKHAAAQEKNDTLPYLKYPKLPAMMLTTLDSAGTINFYDIPEGRPTVLYFFSPDCDHCHITAKALLEHMDEMKGADFYFFSFMPLAMIRSFAEEHHLASYKNITVGKDFQFFFPSFYGATTVPYLVVYDRRKRLVKLYNGGIKPAELAALIQSL